jgi:hypothetical protein
LAVPDQGLYSEYGFDATEQARYALSATVKPAQKFTATAWRFRDSTGAMAMFQARRPAGAKYSKLSDLTATTSDGVIFAHGNYVFQFTGNQPKPEDLAAFYAQLPKLDEAPLPALIEFLPAKGLIPNSERYIVGPVSLERFDPNIAPSAAAFHLGAEGQFGKYQTPKGIVNLLILNYPTPNLARERSDALQKLPGMVVKRTGPLVAVVSGGADPDEAERLLSGVQYNLNVTWNEKAPGQDLKMAANQLLAMFALAGLIVLGSIVMGIGFGGFRLIRRKLGKKEEPDAMITLHLK